MKQVCTNGLVSFGSSTSSSSNRTIPRSSGSPVVAVNWFRFTTYRNNYYNKGRVYYRSTSSGQPDCFIDHVAIIMSARSELARAKAYTVLPLFFVDIFPEASSPLSLKQFCSRNFDY